MASALLARTEFPIYTIRALDENHFLVAGGGGSSKTGVPNAFEIYAVKWDEGNIKSSSLSYHDTGSQAVMNSAICSDGRNHKLAVGLDDDCQVFSIRYKVVAAKEDTKKESSTNDVRQRRTKQTDNKEEPVKNGPQKMVNFDIEKISKFQNSTKVSDHFQKVVKFSPDGNLLYTGSDNGILRCWMHQESKKIFEVSAHSSDIDDLAVSPSGKWVVTVSKDNLGIVWNAKTGKKHTKLNWPCKTKEQYRFRCCEFGCVEGNKNKYNLYTLNIPSRRAIKPIPCYIAKWDGTEFSAKIKKTGTEVLSALSVSDDGDYLGVGSISGSISVYISFSLQRLYHVQESHRIFITGVEFLPVSKSMRAVTGAHDFQLLSISPDHIVQIHKPHTGYYVRMETGLVIIVFGTILILAALVLLLDQLGLIS
ncbi:prolactin regulatory element-binding protein [Octopus sinensis]|uniref:Prolactin regulatory element-binding protein n=1 Tax=Octopus sinensis TaxID=2607531 RepID=A0A6P7TEW2_9MOLL|nr:prolactin regulatory element-binding protein [Octopus sinensis]